LGSALEVSEHNGNYIVRAKLPGIKPEDVKLEITDDSVVLQGERKTEKEESKGGVHLTGTPLWTLLSGRPVAGGR
jgi:HSP20 family protein